MTLAAYPLVPRDEVGFRIQLTAANTDAEVDTLIATLEELAARDELRTPARSSSSRPSRGPEMPIVARVPRCRCGRSTWPVER